MAPPEEPKAALEHRLGFIALASTFFCIVVGAVESVTKFLAVLETHFYVALSVLWLATVVLALRYGPKGGGARLKARRLLIAVATFLYLASIGWTYYEHNLRKTPYAEPPATNLSRLTGVVRAQAGTNPLRIDSFYLNEDYCSFEMTVQLRPGRRPYKTYSVKQDVYLAFRRGQCVGMRGDRPQEDVLPLIRRRLETSGRKDLLPYLRFRSLGRLAQERADIFRQILFSPAELDTMKASSPADYKTVKEWLLNCVGVYQPVFTLVVRNTGKDPLTLNKVIYRVLEADRVLGVGPEGFLFPELTYDHALDWRKGDQERPLNPAIILRPGQTKAFNVRLLAKDPPAGASWLMRIRVLDSLGNFADTEVFELVLNKHKRLD